MDGGFDPSGDTARTVAPPGSDGGRAARGGSAAGQRTAFSRSTASWSTDVRLQKANRTNGAPSSRWS